MYKIVSVQVQEETTIRTNVHPIVNLIMQKKTERGTQFFKYIIRLII